MLVIMPLEITDLIKAALRAGRGIFRGCVSMFIMWLEVIRRMSNAVRKLY